MNIEGPSLASLLHRLIGAPTEFLDDSTDVVATVHDAIARITRAQVDAESIEYFERVANSGAAVERHRRCALLLAWLLTDQWFVDAAVPGPNLWSVMVTVPATLAEDPNAHEWHSDAERREELVRTMLAALGCRPQGETEAQAQDRLTAVSAVQRMRFLAAAAQAEERERELREALAAQAAREAADKMTRE
jgi:hypothetical protein